VVIEGDDERDRGKVTIKDLAKGARLSREISDNVEWRESGAAQIAVARAGMVEAVRDILARQQA